MKKAKKRRATKPKQKPYSIEDGVTQSLLSSWVHCRENARLYLAGWRSSTTGEPLGFGGLEHKLMEGLYNGVRTGQVSHNTDCLQALFDEILKSWCKEIAGWSSPIDPQTAELCVAKAAAIFLAYCDAWPGDFNPSLWRELEGVFDVNWNGYRLRGRIDGVREVGKVKELWLLETKTMGRIDGALEDALSFDFQSQFYMTAAEIVLKRPVKGVLYNVIRRSGFKLKDGESLPQYTARIRADVEKRPDHYFKRFELTFAPEERKRFVGELRAKLDEFACWTDASPHVPNYRDELSCRGRYNCSHLPACSSGSMAGFVEGGRLFEELE